NIVHPLGSDTPLTVDLRYVAATSKDLEAMVERGAFRRDLFERLAGSVLRIPPLRDRPEDVLEIGRHFVAPYLRPEDEERRAAVEAWLRSREARRHRWPGNVRELQNALRSLLLGLDPGLGGAAAARPADEQPAWQAPGPIRRFEAPLRDVEDWYRRQVVARAGGNLSRAARVLEVDRATLRRRMRA
ncbi:MAG TPA: sigma 54-interacting transcriptional regulator, partial [Kofleriaceae bacterium]|nr:sigma 54-interacting transcriptional regulator [Kofleriaceae bacterium]